MSKPAFAMSMFASKADLFEAKAEYFEQQLKKLRDEFAELHAVAAQQVPYLDESESGYADGKEFAYEEVVDALNKVLGE